MPSRTAFGQPTRQFIKIRSLPQAPEQYSKDDQDAVRRFIELAFVEQTPAEEGCCLLCQTGNPETVVSGTIGCIDEVTDAPLTTHPIWIKREADDGNITSPNDTIGWYGWNGLRGNRGVDTTFRIGDNAVVGNTSSYAIAFGDVATATSSKSIAMGYSPDATGADAIAFGSDAQATAASAVSIGKVANVAYQNGVAIGNGAEVKNNVAGGVAIGNGAIANKRSAGSVGDAASTIAIGATEAKEAGEINIGSNNVNTNTAAGSASNKQSIFVGHDIAFTGRDGYGVIIIGPTSVSRGDGGGEVVVGEGCRSGNVTNDNSSGNVLVGQGIDINIADDGFQGVAVGQYAVIAGDCCVAVGHDSLVRADFATAVGPHAECGTGNPDTVNSQIAVGRLAVAWGHRSSALGTDSFVNHEGSTALGYGATTTASKEFMLGSSGAPIDVMKVVTSAGVVTIVF